MEDLGVLVGGDGHEGGLREGEGLEDAPADAVQVVSLNDVETRVVAMHGVEDDLQGAAEGEERFRESSRRHQVFSLREPGLTCPCWSSVLLVSLSFKKETDCFIQWLPLAGESGWTYVLQGG